MGGSGDSGGDLIFLIVNHDFIYGCKKLICSSYLHGVTFQLSLHFSAETKISYMCFYITDFWQLETLFGHWVSTTAWGVTTVKVIVEEVCDAIWKNLAPIVMSQPTEQMWRDIAKEFENIWHFPNCIGSLDGKHVTITFPIKAGSTFYNYKNEHSIILLALVDANYRFIMVDVGAYGRNSDGGIYQGSLMGKKFDRSQLNVTPNKPINQNTEPLPYTIVADAAFPLKTYLLKVKPYSKAN